MRARLRWLLRLPQPGPVHNHIVVVYAISWRNCCRRSSHDGPGHALTATTSSRYQFIESNVAAAILAESPAYNNA